MKVPRSFYNLIFKGCMGSFLIFGWDKDKPRKLGQRGVLPTEPRQVIGQSCKPSSLMTSLRWRIYWKSGDKFQGNAEERLTVAPSTVPTPNGDNEKNKG